MKPSFFKKYSENIVAILIALSYFFIALLYSLRNSLWHDESYTYLMIQSSFSKIIYYTSLDVHPPLYYLILKAWSNAFGYSILSLNVFSIFCMIGAVLIFWKLFLKVYNPSNNYLKYLLLILMFFGPFTIRYGQEIRMYALGTLITALIIYFVYTLINSRNKNTLLWVLLGVLLALGFYVHYFLVFNLIAFVCYFLFMTVKKSGFKSLFNKFHEWYIPVFVFIAFVAVWIPRAINQFIEVNNGFWIAPIDGSSVQNYFITYSLYLNDWELRNYLGILGTISLIVSILALYRYFKIKTLSNFHLISIVWLTAPLLLLIFISLPPFSPAFHPRYLFFWSPLLYGAIAVGLMYSLKRNKYNKFLLLIYISIISIGIFMTFNIGHSSSFDKQKPFSMNQVVDFIQQNDSGNSAIVSQDLWNFFDLYATVNEKNLEKNIFVYKEDGFGKYGNHSLVHDRDDLVVNSLEDSRLNDNDRIWLLTSNTDNYIKPNVPDSWKLLSSMPKGYVVLNEYEVIK